MIGRLGNCHNGHFDLEIKSLPRRFPRATQQQAGGPNHPRSASPGVTAQIARPPGRAIFYGVAS